MGVLDWETLAADQPADDEALAIPAAVEANGGERNARARGKEALG